MGAEFRFEGKTALMIDASRSQIVLARRRTERVALIATDDRISAQ